MRALLLPYGLLVVAGIAIAIQLKFVAPANRITRLTNQDEWSAVRDQAARLAHQKGRIRAIAPGTAFYLLGLANLVLGDLPAAQRALERAQERRHELPPPVSGAVARQLAAVAAMSGRVDDALSMIDHPDAGTGTSGWEVPTQRAMIHLAGDEPRAAAAVAATAVSALDDALDRPQTTKMRAALTADQVVARSVLIRALVGAGDLGEATGEWEEHLRHHESDRPYVRGTLAEAGALLAHARGERSAAQDLVEMARQHYREVGAVIDVARADVLAARIGRDRTLLDASEQTLVQLGALGYLNEVEAARAEMEWDG